MTHGIHRRRAPWSRGVPAAAAALLVAGCAIGDLVDGRRGVMMDAGPQEVSRSEAASPYRREHEQILSTFGGAYTSPPLEALMADLVGRLTIASDRPDLRYTVTILNSPGINAFALPTGQLYVTRGLIALADDGAELASVLAHEMAHVTARHAAIRETEARRAELVSRVATDVLGDARTGATTLANARVTLASFSRAQELEADAIGVTNLARAGFDPYGAARVLAAMERLAALRAATGETRENAVDFLATHPSTPERYRTALAHARQFVGPGAGDRDRDRFLAAVDGLTYGDDLREAALVGRRFVSARLGFEFTVPDGWSAELAGRALLAARPDGAEALRLDFGPLPDDGSLAGSLEAGWIDGVPSRDVEPLMLDGLPAATAVARGEEWSFRLVAVRVGNEMMRMVFAGRSLEASDAGFLRAARTIRPSTEIVPPRGRRIAVVDVRAGDTVRTLAERMAYPANKVERFLALNGLEPGAAVRPGQRVRIVMQ